MRIHLRLLRLILALTFVPCPGYAEVRQETNSADPESYLPAQEGKQLLKALCTSCHDLSRVIAQRRDSQTWKQTVHQMLAGWDPQYAEYLEEDVKILSRYLAQYFGPLTPAYETLQGDPALKEKYLRGEIKSLININTASIAELTRLPGINKDTAEQLIQYRTARGSFHSTDELKPFVKVDDKEFEKLKVLVTVD